MPPEQCYRLVNHGKDMVQNSKELSVSKKEKRLYYGGWANETPFEQSFLK